MAWSHHPSVLLSCCFKGKQFSGLSLKSSSPSIIFPRFAVKGCAKPFLVTEQFPSCPAEEKAKRIEVSVLPTNLHSCCKLK